jgi:hypothetical protein
MATTSFSRGLGGAIGSAVLGAVFAAQAGALRVAGDPSTIGPAARAEVIDGARTVFLVAAPIAALALLLVLLLREVPLQTERGPRPGPTTTTPPARATAGATR